jgi:hypothetical protein
MRFAFLLILALSATAVQAVPAHGPFVVLRYDAAGVQVGRDEVLSLDSAGDGPWTGYGAEYSLVYSEGPAGQRYELHGADGLAVAVPVTWSGTGSSGPLAAVDGAGFYELLTPSALDDRAHREMSVTLVKLLGMVLGVGLFKVVRDSFWHHGDAM